MGHSAHRRQVRLLKRSSTTSSDDTAAGSSPALDATETLQYILLLCLFDGIHVPACAAMSTVSVSSVLAREQRVDAAQCRSTAVCVARVARLACLRRNSNSERMQHIRGRPCAELHTHSINIHLCHLLHAQL
jgi:hypothetical protein